MTYTLLSALVNGVIVSVAGTLGVALCLHFVRRSTLNSATRYGIWFVALLLVVGLPLLVIRIPSAQIPVPTVPRLGELPLADLSQGQLIVGVADGNASVETNVRASSGVPGPAVTVRDFATRIWVMQPFRVHGGLWLDGVLLAWLIASLLLVCRLAFGYRAAADTLARRGARIDHVVVAAAVGRLDLVKAWVVDANTLVKEHGPYRGPYWVHIPDDTKGQIELALVWACKFGRSDVARALLDLGVDPAAKDNDKMSALHWAAGRGCWRSWRCSSRKEFRWKSGTPGAEPCWTRPRGSPGTCRRQALIIRGSSRGCLKRARTRGRCIRPRLESPPSIWSSSGIVTRDS